MVNGLRNGTRYTFAVRARNDAGDGVERTVTATPGGRSNNNAPVAHATWEYVDRYNEHGRLIQTDLHLNGRASSDPDLSEFGAEQYKYLTFRWTQVRDDPSAPRHEPKPPDRSRPYLSPNRHIPST